MGNKKPRPGSFVRQAAILMGASLFVRLLGFFYRIPIIKLIGDIGNNYYSSAYQIYVFALDLTSVAMIATLSRLTSERIALGRYRAAHSIFKTTMVLTMVLGAAGSFVLFFGADLIERILNVQNAGTVAPSIKTIAPAVFIVSVLHVFRGYFQGMKTTAPTAISQVIEQIINVAFSLWLAYIFYDKVLLELPSAGAAGGTVIASIAALGVFMFIYALVAQPLRKRAEEDNTRHSESLQTQLSSIFRTAYPLIIALSAVTLSHILDISMSNSRILSSGEFAKEEIEIMVGQYTGKFNLFTSMPASFSTALAAAVLPEITSAFVTKDEKSVRQKTNLALRIAMMLSIPSAVGLAVMADPVISMLFPEHPEGGWLITYGAVSIVFLAVYTVITSVLQGCGYMKIPLIGLAAGIIVKIALNYFLLPIAVFNILGAVISTIACFLVAATVNLYLLRRFIGFLPDLPGAVIKPTVASAAMGLVCYSVFNLLKLFTGHAVSTLCAIALGGITYVVFLVLIKGFGEHELELLPIPEKIRRMMR